MMGYGGDGMSCNVGNTDRIIRFIIGAVLLLAVLLGWVQATTAWVLGIVGLILVLTAWVKFCPLYRILGLSTCSEA